MNAKQIKDIEYRGPWQPLDLFWELLLLELPVHAVKVSKKKYL